MARSNLSDCFRLASILAVSFFELQNISSLHKYFNSDNILYFANSAGEVSFSESLVSGFEFSRRDKVGQVSLQMRRSPLDIYYHPDLRQARSSSAEQPAYTMLYDVYSLWLVLFETGMWSRVDGFLEPEITAGEFRARVLTCVEQNLLMLIGDGHRDVV
ncbi:hypothetical protein MMC22_001547, partial [Lobaria immixta]|nr:hypothetical protein [Lobaria immixta]